jgi:hypothetical protein
VDEIDRRQVLVHEPLVEGVLDVCALALFGGRVDFWLRHADELRRYWRERQRRNGGKRLRGNGGSAGTGGGGS